MNDLVFHDGGNSIRVTDDNGVSGDINAIVEALNYDGDVRFVTL
jgi:hypothetical protein